MFKEYEVVVLKRPIVGIPIPAGTRGTILIVYFNIPPEYEVEFVDSEYKSLGSYTVSHADLQPNLPLNTA